MLEAPVNQLGEIPRVSDRGIGQGKQCWRILMGGRTYKQLGHTVPLLVLRSRVRHVPRATAPEDIPTNCVCFRPLGSSLFGAGFMTYISSLPN